MTVPEESTEDPAVMRALTAVLGAQFGNPKIAPDDNFFALGGDSLTALRVVSDAREVGLPITLRDLLTHQSIRGLSRALSGIAAVEAEAQSTQSIEAFELLAAEDRAQLPVTVIDALSASALQVGMIYECESSPDGRLYHTLAGWEVLTRFDEDAFRQALADLSTRHTALRTSFELGELSVPTQLIWSEAEPVLTIDRLPLPAPDQAAVLVRDWRREQSEHPISWEAPPLVRWHVVIQPKSFHVLLAAHHVIHDGWSLGRLTTDLMRLYDARLHGRDIDLPTVPADIERQFIRAEQDIQDSVEAAAFWSQQADAKPLLFSTGQLSGVPDASASVGFPVAEATLAKLRKAAREMGVPLKAVAAAAHARALSAWVGRDSDVVTGLVINTRPQHPGSDLAVGLYLNTVPVRFASLDRSWADLAREVADFERDAEPFRGYPMARIQERLGRQPFDVTFNFTNFHVYQERETAGMPCTRNWWIESKPSFPVCVHFEIDETTHSTQVRIGFDSALLPEGDVERYARLYQRALSVIADDPHSLAVIEPATGMGGSPT